MHICQRGPSQAYVASSGYVSKLCISVMLHAFILSFVTNLREYVWPGSHSADSFRNAQHSFCFYVPQRPRAAKVYGRLHAMSQVRVERNVTRK